MSISLEELDDFTDSGSDYEATIKPTKRRKQALPRPQPPKRPRRKAALRATSNPSSSPIPSPPDPSLQQQQQQKSRGTYRQVSPRSVRRVDERNQAISAEDIYDAVRSGRSAMVVSIASAENMEGRGNGL
ncbi:hypothetical protein INR49_013539 [Caranx melampygus]|nr:hypothetical protein INR49_013539 [Caranx melampygus]